MEGKGSKGRGKVVFHRVWTGRGRRARGARSSGRGGDRAEADETRLAGGTGIADAKCARIVHFVTGLSRAGGLLVGEQVVEYATGMSARSRGPVSVVLPEDLRERVVREAKRRGLGVSPVLRTLVAERLRQLEEEAELSEIERWQRAEAWKSWKEGSDATWDEVDAAFEDDDE